MYKIKCNFGLYLKKSKKVTPYHLLMEIGSDQVTNFLSVVQGLTGENFGSKIDLPR